MSSAEFTRWIQYADKEPFGYPMDNYRAFTSAASVINAIRATIPLEKGKSRPKPMKASDLYPDQKKRGPGLTPEQTEHLRKKHAKRKRR